MLIHVYSGNWSTIRIWFFCIFQAFGCLNPNPPADGLANRQGDRALITCKYSNVQWELTCEDGEWLGHFGICAKSKMPHALTQKHTHAYMYDEILQEVNRNICTNPSMASTNIMIIFINVFIYISKWLDDTKWNKLLGPLWMMFARRSVLSVYTNNTMYSF